MKLHRIAPLLASAALLGAANAQVLVAYNATTDTLVAFSPVDGSLIDTNFLAVPATAQWASIAVGTEIWVTEQLQDRLVRYDHGGNVLGVIGPTFPGGGFDNIRGLTLIGGTVYVTNDGSANGATADSLVTFDTAGNHLGTIPLANSPSPFCVLPWQGGLLVSSSSDNDDIHRYTLGGASLGTFHNTAGLQFANQISLASDGNVWCCPLTSSSVVKLDATTGTIVQSFPAGSGRGVHELQNGNVMWTSTNGAFVYDVGTNTSSLVFAGSSYHLTLLPNDVSFHKHVGTGCHTFRVDRSNLVQLFATVNDAKAGLEGNALRFTLTGNGYVATWLPGQAGTLFVPPTLGATIVANVSTGQETFTPSVAIPIPGGTTATWTLSTEGVLTAGSTGNHPNDVTPALVDVGNATGLSFYTWFTQNPTETSSGKFKREEIGNMLYVTSEGVELSGGTPTLSPNTYQWQIDMTSGEVTMVWTSFTTNNSTSDVIVGCTLAGIGGTPVSQTLSTASAVILQPDLTQDPLTLFASPAPVINPSTNVTYLVSNVPEVVPGSGVYAVLLFLSLNPAPAGIDVTNILTTVPGCNLYISTFDVALGGFAASPTVGIPFTFSAPTFAPGNTIGVQAIALFDAAFPLLNGESGGFVLSNGVVSTTFAQ